MTPLQQLQLEHANGQHFDQMCQDTLTDRFFLFISPFHFSPSLCHTQTMCATHNDLKCCSLQCKQCTTSECLNDDQQCKTNPVCERNVVLDHATVDATIMQSYMHVHTHIYTML